MIFYPQRRAHAPNCVSGSRTCFPLFLIAPAHIDILPIRVERPLNAISALSNARSIATAAQIVSCAPNRPNVRPSLIVH